MPSTGCRFYLTWYEGNEHDWLVIAPPTATSITVPTLPAFNLRPAVGAYLFATLRLHDFDADLGYADLRRRPSRRLEKPVSIEGASVAEPYRGTVVVAY